MTTKKIAVRVPVSPAAIKKRLATPYAKLNAQASNRNAEPSKDKDRNRHSS
jgi:hypothetical protein